MTARLLRSKMVLKPYIFFIMTLLRPGSYCHNDPRRKGEIAGAKCEVLGRRVFLKAAVGEMSFEDAWALAMSDVTCTSYQ